MKLKTVKTLSIITIVIQLITLFITLGMVATQESVKRWMVYDESVLEIKSIPIAAICNSVIPLLLFIIFTCIVFLAGNRNTKPVACALLIIACLLKVGMYYIPIVENRVAAISGVNALASLSALNQAVSMVCSPLFLSALALFFFALGGYFGLKKED